MAVSYNSFIFILLTNTKEIMGCFSFMCKKTGRSALSTSFNGSPVHMFLLKNGRVIEHMHGNYDSYGRVFSNEKDPKDTSLTHTTSFEWALDWSDVCDLMFNPSKSNGIAIILDPHWKEGDPYPTERSDDDPNQGWGDGGEFFGDDRDGGFEKVEEPFHKLIS